MAKILKALNTWQMAGVGLSVTWSLLLGAVFSRLPIVQKLELGIQDSLTRLYKPDDLPKEILIVTVDSAIAKPEHNFYANLVERLITQKAKVVVINLPHSLRRPLDSSLENPLKELIRKYSDQIVLVTYTKKRSQQIPSALPIYYHLLPFDDKRIKPKINPEQVHGFFEYETNLLDLTSPARQAHLIGHFAYVEELHQTHELKSVAVLALEKFSSPLANKVIAQIENNQPSCTDITCISQTAIGINFYGHAGIFPRINTSTICKPTPTQLNQCSIPLSNFEAQKIQNKLVLIDLPKEYLASTSMLSPFGDRLSVAEVQANLIGNLMTDSFLRTSQSWFNSIITTLGAIFFSLLVSFQIIQNKSQYIHSKIWLSLGVIGGYIGLGLLSFQQELTVPLATPILTWLGTGASVAICLLLWQKQQQLRTQRQALAERQAVLLQARKLLHRVATDIHDGPLQELKLVMDGIELLAIKHPTLNPDPLLERLEAVGRDLRNQLSNTRTMAEKLEITPELQAGLDKGIEQRLQQLVSTGELTLKVESCLQPLLEPEDSNWLDTREDIFRFFKEAIANVIRHAQPPNGTATRVTVSLSQSGTQCTLSVEKDAIEFFISESSKRSHLSGSYGTKLMTTIAAELPGGYWERVPLAHGGMQVRLSWKLEATDVTKLN